MAMFAVTTAKGPNWDDGRSIRDQKGWAEHAIFIDGLVERGVIVLGGPIGGGSDEDVALLAVDAASEQELRSAFSDDPWAANGVFRIKEVRPWTLWLDGSRAGLGQHQAP
ncbi:MAG: YciI family protein [Acidimicrobiales bacterium]